MPPKVVLPQPLTRALYFILYCGGSTFPLFMQNEFWSFEKLSQIDSSVQERGLGEDGYLTDRHKYIIKKNFFEI